MFGNETSVARLSYIERQNPETSATIIFSASVRQTCFSSYPIVVDLIEEESGETLKYFTANNEFVRPQLDENHGFLHAANVPPGDYLITLDIGVRRTVSAPVAHLSLAQNDLVYLGEIFIDSACAGFGNSDNILINNQAERDLGKAEELNPAIIAEDVELRILRFEND
ncbi:MAG: hypothetical protein AAF697_05790 [Pseudomonadota bacterium]